MSPRLPLLLVALGLLACEGGNTGADGSDLPGGADVSADSDTSVKDTTGGGKDVDIKPDGASGPNRPPVLSRIGDRIVAVGETLSLHLEAEDPDGDTLSFSVFGSLPEGAKFLKAERRFEWTPDTAPDTVFLTFVASDGQAFDRETVRIEVVSEKSDNPPVLSPVGDQTVVVGEAYELKLVAVDPDGDAVTFGYDGNLPEGAALDEASGRFSWTPPAALAGKTVRVTFTASDGALVAKLEVTFVVRDGAGGGPSPPVFDPLEPVSVKLGETVGLTLSAKDADGDPVSYGIFGEPPAGAKLVGAVFTWTPVAADAGKSYTVTFSATDGTFTSFTSVDIEVVSNATVGDPDCTDDVGEPNETFGTATTLVAGELGASICDTELSPLDVDIYRLSLGAAQTAEITLSFDPQAGDLDLLLFDASQKVLAASETAAAVEALSWEATAAQDVFVVVTGVGQPSFHMGYTLKTAVVQGAACQADSLEPNGTFAQAKPLPAPGAQLTICPADLDYFQVALTCGQAFTATMTIAGTGDLDLALWSGGDTEGDPLAQAATTKAVEELSLASAPAPGTYFLRVSGYPPSSGQGGYTLATSTTGGCVEDSLGGNSSAASAHLLEGLEGTLGDLRLCCKSDWFALAVGAGDEVLFAVDAKAGQTGAMSLTAFAPDQATVLDTSGPSATGGTLGFTAQAAGTHLVRVSGATGSSYAAEWLVDPATEPPPVGCTPLSCPLYEVCDSTTGDCVSDFCADDSACPTGHLCRDTYCINACANPADCRGGLGYTCKAFDAGLYCGIEGPGGPGATCYDHVECSGQAVCAFPASGGYCATLGCGGPGPSCGDGTSCADHPQGGTFCAVSCDAAADCRTDDGFTCTEALCQPE